MEIAYVLAYRAPNYIRTESLLKALGSSSRIRVAVARNSHSGIRRYIETWNELRRIRTQCKPDVYILGFRGHEFFWPVRLLTKGKPLILDALMSPYASLMEEHGGSLLHRCLAAIIYPFERSALNQADFVLTDTELQADFYSRVFAVSRKRILALPVGAVEQGPNREAQTSSQPSLFSVLFYGSFLSLHGIDTIVQAAEKLAHLPIRFDFVGGSKRHSKRLHRSCAACGVTKYTHRRWVPFKQLLEIDIANADLCLGGPFGGTPQARRVVTGKASQCLAMGKATVIGRIDEDNGFIDQTNCLLVDQSDPHGLARAIAWAYNHKPALQDIGARGRTLYNNRLSVHVITARLEPLIRELAMQPAIQ